MRPLFALIARGYWAVTKVRNDLYEKGTLKIYRSKVPVVSIGNLSVGGTGKTPLCIWLAQELKKRDLRPVVLTRGYGGKSTGTVEVTASSDATTMGDEPLVIFRRAEVPVVVSPNRVAGAKYIERSGLGNIIILDDGFQHRALGRATDIICIDASTTESATEFVAGELLPLGRFREEKTAALKRANFAVINSRQSELLLETVEQIRAVLPVSCPAFETRLIVDGLFDGNGSKTTLAEGTEVIAFCGLANPDGFFNTVQGLGVKIKEYVVLRDHQAISDQLLLELMKGSRPVICSEKDQIKLGPSYRKVLALRVSLKVSLGEKLVIGILSRCKIGTM